MRYFLAVVLSSVLLWGQEDYARQDALIFQASYFAPLDTLTMATFWRATALRSESMYNGNGSWGLGYADWPSRPYDADHPLVRVVARHALGLLLLMEQGLADSTVRHRARLALNWLLQRQTTEGVWPLYTQNRGVISMFSLYPTALAGRALSRGYQILDNPRYQLAAARALEWQRVRPESDSPFHRGLVLSQLLEQHRALPNMDLLTQAIEEAFIILGSQLPNGSWSDPTPVHSDEHAIITEALLMLEQALIKAHPRRRRLQAGITRAFNFMLASQEPNGNFATGADESRAAKVPTFELLLLVRARLVREMPEFDLPITGAIRAMNRNTALQGNLWRGSQDGRFLAMAHALTWFVSTQTGLPPTPPPELPRRDTLVVEPEAGALRDTLEMESAPARADSVVLDSLDSPAPTLLDSISLPVQPDSGAVIDSVLGGSVQ